MDINLLRNVVRDFKPTRLLEYKGVLTSPIKDSTLVRQPAKDLFQHSSTSVAETTRHVAQYMPINPSKGAPLGLNPAQRKSIASVVTQNPEEQKLLMDFVEKETIHVTDAVEQGVMKTQFANVMKNHPDIKPNEVYVYSPQPKGYIKSYTKSGETFANANGIDKSHIVTDFENVPEGSTVFMPDDCSITGASMVFDLLEKLPPDFKGRIVMAPTVKGAGESLVNRPLAEDVLNSFSSINSKGADRKSIAEQLKGLIADNKKDNKDALDALTNGSNYSNVDIEIATGSLRAPNFKETETFRNLPRSQQRLLDSMVTADGVNTGYHDSGVMVLFQEKGPNNNIGIMDVVGSVMGKKPKPSGVLSYADTMELNRNGMRCALAACPKTNKHGNSSELILESFADGKKTGYVPYSVKDGKPVEFVIRFADGKTQKVSYNAKLEDKLKFETEKLYGFEPDASATNIRTYKGLYKDRTVKSKFGYRTDVLAIPKDAQIVSVDGQPLESIMKLNHS